MKSDGKAISAFLHDEYKRGGEEMRRLLIIGAGIFVGLTMLIAQITTVGACPPLIVYQPSLPKALKENNAE